MGKKSIQRGATATSLPVGRKKATHGHLPAWWTQCSGENSLVSALMEESQHYLPQEGASTR